MIIVNGFQPLTIITKSSTLDVAAVLDPPLKQMLSLISLREVERRNITTQNKSRKHTSKKY